MATRFGEVLEEIREIAGSWRAMELMMLERTGQKYSFQHFINLARGTATPTFETALRISRAYPEYAEKLFGALDYPIPPEFQSVQPVLDPTDELLAAIPGAKRLAPSGTRLPLGPPISAMRGDWPWDGPPTETIDPVAGWTNQGATMAIRVDGPCLEPDLKLGDAVALRLQDHAAHGDIVLARLEDGSYTLKRYVINGSPHLTTADPEKYPPPTGLFKIIAVVVGSARQGAS